MGFLFLRIVLTSSYIDCPVLFEFGLKIPVYMCSGKLVSRLSPSILSVQCCGRFPDVSHFELSLSAVLFFAMTCDYFTQRLGMLADDLHTRLIIHDSNVRR